MSVAKEKRSRHFRFFFFFPWVLGVARPESRVINRRRDYATQCNPVPPPLAVGRVLFECKHQLSVFLVVPGGRGTSLHYCALAAAALLVFVHLEALHVVVAGAAAAGVRGHVPVISPDLTDDVEEGVVDVDTGPGGCLDELAAETTCECGTLCLMLACASWCNT
jgi:hypothetical protein